MKKTVVIGTCILFASIFVLSLIKKNRLSKVQSNSVQMIDLKEEKEIVDKVDKLFVFDSTKLPVVDTITYTSRVPWLKDRPAWIADYASFYKTTRHFIARSLNKKIDYYTQNINPGDRFNVLKKEISFYLVISLEESSLRFYALDEVENKNYLLKTYKIGLGRRDTKKESGYLTPKGKYLLGEKVAIYKPGIMGHFQDQSIEMIRVFGTRWIPFEKEMEGCTDGAKGYGLHGAPWVFDAKEKKMIEDRSKIGEYDSDGCIRLYKEDIEEIFAIIISRPSVIEIVQNFEDANIPGEEVL